MNYWNSQIKNIESYAPGEQPRDREYIKLNTNENPYPPSPLVVEALKKAVASTLRLYPDPTCLDLRRAISEYYGTKPENVFVGNGSDEVLAFCFGAFFDRDKPLLFPDISYSFYPVYAKFFNLPYKQVPVDDSFKILPKEYFQANSGIVIPNPNAPTSLSLSLTEIEKIVKFNFDQSKVAIIDEAYIDFGGETCIPLIERYSNLLVIQTLSKSRSLAGMRVGFALGSSGLIEGLEKVKGSINSYTVDRLAMVGAVAAIKDKKYFERTRRKIVSTREWVSVELQRLGFRVLESKANFVFVSSEKIQAEELYAQLKTRGILVRYFKKDRVDNFIRVSIGNDREMKTFINAVSEISRATNV